MPNELTPALQSLSMRNDLANRLDECAHFFERCIDSNLRDSVPQGMAQAGELAIAAMHTDAFPEWSEGELAKLPAPLHQQSHSHVWIMMWTTIRYQYGPPMVRQAEEYELPTSPDGWKAVALNHAATCRVLARRLRGSFDRSTKSGLIAALAEKFNLLAVRSVPEAGEPAWASIPDLAKLFRVAAGRYPAFEKRVRRLHRQFPNDTTFVRRLEERPANEAQFEFCVERVRNCAKGVI